MGRRSDALATLTVTRLDAMMRHPEQLLNLTAVARLLQRFDDAGNDPIRLHELQAELFRPGTPRRRFCWSRASTSGSYSTSSGIPSSARPGATPTSPRN
jgi:hypothetical protein